MLALPDRVWIARREFERWDGIELVEHIIYDQNFAAELRIDGYEVTEFVSRERMRGLIHAASSTGRLPVE